MNGKARMPIRASNFCESDSATPLPHICCRMHRRVLGYPLPFALAPTLALRGAAWPELQARPLHKPNLLRRRPKRADGFPAS